MGKFKKAGEIQLVNGGYLSDKDENPITNSEFVTAQLRAHRLVCIAAAMEGKNFTTQKVDSMDAIIAQVDAQLSATVSTQFVTVPKVKKGELTQQLAQEALSFMEAGEKAGNAEYINSQMQEFQIINEFEAHGLFFKSGITKLEKIYTIKDITKAAKAVYSVL